MKDELLSRFCRAVMENVQTPELINRMASDEEFIRVCRRLSTAEVDLHFAVFCRQNQFNDWRIRQRLLPVARALRLTPCMAPDSLDYYELLGVPADADAQTIKNAFRHKAKLLHPDKRPGDDGLRFMALQTAYVHLSDSDLRAQYDRRRPNETWVESRSDSDSRAQERHLRRSSWLIWILTTALVASAFAIDLYFQESSFFKPDVEHQNSAGSDTGK